MEKPDYSIIDNYILEFIKNIRQSELDGCDELSYKCYKLIEEIAIKFNDDSNVQKKLAWYDTCRSNLSSAIRGTEEVRVNTVTIVENLYNKYLKPQPL